MVRQELNYIRTPVPESKPLEHPMPQRARRGMDFETGWQVSNLPAGPLPPFRPNVT